MLRPRAFAATPNVVLADSVIAAAAAASTSTLTSAGTLASPTLSRSASPSFVPPGHMPGMTDVDISSSVLALRTLGSFDFEGMH